MKLTAEQKDTINKRFTKRAEIKEKLDHNINEVARLRNMMKREKNPDNYWKMFDKVKEGEQYIAAQTYQYNQLSIKKIASEVDVNYSAIKNYEYRKRDVRESLGI